MVERLASAPTGRQPARAGPLGTESDVRETGPVHELTDARVLEGIAFLLQHAPPQLRLVIAARADPPLPLHRLLVSGELTQIRTADLAFTVGEVAELLDGYDYRSSLSDDDLAALQARTEGWAAGLRLAALSLQSQPDPHQFIAELAGDDRSIADYLVGEVLDRLPEELRRFVCGPAWSTS
jgi:LuxR family transcriptional regulator, maltose regulon positive regulatory protein